MNHANRISLEEKAIAREVLRGDRDLNDFSFYKSSLDRNLDLKFLPRLKHVAVVGGGSIPTTAITLHQLEICSRLTVIDIDDEALELGQKILSLLGIKADMVNCSGDSFDFSGCDGVYIANLVQNKNEVVKTCERQLASGSYLILRCSSMLQDGVDSFGPTDMSSLRWRLIEEGADSIAFNSKNYFYQKI